MRPRHQRARQMIALVVGLLVLAGHPPIPAVAETGAPDELATVARTPPRLSFADGQVSFWRPGAQDWTQAQVNTPLAPGDQLYTGSPGNLELQIGGRAFVRGWANTQLGLENQEPDFVQLKVTAGHASFDLRTLEPGRTVEVDTPNAAFTIEHTGYYRVDIVGERTSFITRRGGQATVTPASGPAVAITASEEVVIEGTSSPHVASYVAPQLDDWDSWNYARTERLLDAVSPRYVSPGTYGVSDLDHYGNWRVVSDYGPVWVPAAVPGGWVPYSTGSWMLDPYYGWTWVDTAPWGWAPYHHGRWVFVDGFWAWAPGPVLVRPVYAPALVAFFGGPVVGWVALGWGEPLVPWWGPVGFVRSPWWGGWGGPRVVNNVVINRTTVVNVQNITVYRNTNVKNAVVAVNENHFGRGPITSARVAQVDVKNLQLIHRAPNATATPASFVPTGSRGVRPPDERLTRPVVATRPPHSSSESATGGERKGGPPGIVTPPPRLVSAPQQHEAALTPPRPPFGQSKAERSTAGPTQPSPPRRLEGPRRPERTSEGAPPAPRQAPPQLRREPPVIGSAPSPPQPAPGPAGQRGPQGAPPAPRQAPPQLRREQQVAAPPLAAPQPPARHPEAQRPPARSLPGEPANVLSPNRAETRPPPHETMRAPQRGEHQAPSPPVRPRPAPENAPRERSGG
jgi:uncharacterized protein DUF6600